MPCSVKDYFHEVHIPYFFKENFLVTNVLFMYGFFMAIWGSYENKLFLLAVLPSIMYFVYLLTPSEKTVSFFNRFQEWKFFYFFSVIFLILSIISVIEVFNNENILKSLIFLGFFFVFLFVATLFVFRTVLFKFTTPDGLYLSNHLARAQILENIKKDWLKFFDNSQVESAFSTGLLYLEGTPELSLEKETSFCRIRICKKADEYSWFFDMKLETKLNSESGVFVKPLGAVFEDMFKFHSSFHRFFLKAHYLNKDCIFYGQSSERMNLLLTKLVNSLEF